MGLAWVNSDALRRRVLARTRRISTGRQHEAGVEVVDSGAEHHTNHVTVEVNQLSTRIALFRIVNCGYSVELPGIEPVSEIELTCENTEFGYAKRRESTRNYLRIRQRC